MTTTSASSPARTAAGRPIARKLAWITGGVLAVGALFVAVVLPGQDSAGAGMLSGLLAFAAICWVALAWASRARTVGRGVLRLLAGPAVILLLCVVAMLFG